MVNETITDKSVDNKKPLPKGWKWVKLGDVCEINPHRNNFERQDNTLTTFVPMSAIDERKGVIARPEAKPYQQIKKGYTFFTEKDVLFAKITPCMENGKHAIASHLIDNIGFGSTEFHVLRPLEQITSNWIHYFIRQPSVLKAATTHFTGAVGQQRVPAKFLTELEIPLPPLAEQKRIAAILSEQLAAVERARKAAQEQLEAAKALPAAYLREVFESEEAKRWERRKLGEIFRLKSGDFLSTKQMNLKGHYPVYGGNGITGYHDEYRFEEPKVIIGRVGANCGCVHVSQPKSWITDNALYVSDRLFPFCNDWVVLCLKKLNLNKISNSMAQPLVSGQLIYPLEIPLPSLTVQKQITEEVNFRTRGIDKLENSLKTQLEAINKLPSALLQRAFSGEL